MPKTLAVLGAPNAAKSVTTLRGGECDGVGIEVEDTDKMGDVGFRAGEYGAYVPYERPEDMRACRYLSVKRLCGTCKTSSGCQKIHTTRGRVAGNTYSFKQRFCFGQGR